MPEHAQASDEPAPEFMKLSPARAAARLEEAAQDCTRCPLYKGATQAVCGVGPVSARIMLVGEQPGDREDLEGEPFVGPAGMVLDQALEDAGLTRRKVYLTNAVKHFKNEPRGKRRLHKRPTAYEVDRCRWWFKLEREIVRPKIIVTLGATAIRGVTGKSATIKSLRGESFTLEDGVTGVATIHPSSLLRTQDKEDKKRKRRRFVADLERAVALAQGKGG